MKTLLKNRSGLFVILIAALLALCFVTAFFHHHEDGDAAHDCPVCRLVQTISGIFILALSAILAAVLQEQKSFAPFAIRFPSRLLTVSLKDRAPPRLLSL